MTVALIVAAVGSWALTVVALLLVREESRFVDEALAAANNCLDHAEKMLPDVQTLCQARLLALTALRDPDMDTRHEAQVDLVALLTEEDTDGSAG